MSHLCEDCQKTLDIYPDAYRFCPTCEGEQPVLVYNPENGSDKGVQTKMVFEENNPGIFEFKEVDDNLTGELLQIQDDVGPSNSKLYTLMVDGKAINVWGTTILDQRMVGISIGETIKIVYKGLGTAQAGKNAPKIFQVLVDRNIPKVDNVGVV